MNEKHHESTPQRPATHEGLPVAQSGPADPYVYAPSAGGPDAGPSRGGLAAYLHALRRRWWMALALGLLCGGIQATWSETGCRRGRS